LEGLIAQARVEHGPVTLSVGASCGAVTLLPGTTTAALIDAADMAMYARKKAKRG
jgi:PleD family two-component response regulator